MTFPLPAVAPIPAAEISFGDLWGDGDPDEGPGALAALRDLRPAADTFGMYPYTAIQQWFDEGTPHGRRYHVRSEWLGSLAAAAPASNSTTSNAIDAIAAE